MVSAGSNSASPHNMVLSAPIDRWDEAIPLGNGVFGALLWGNSETIKLSIDRGDLWDLRMPQGYKHKDFTWQSLRRLVAKGDVESIEKLFDKPFIESPYPTKIRAGRIELNLKQDANVQSFTLDLLHAQGEVKLKNGFIEVFLSAVEPVGFIKAKGIDAEIKICPVPFDGVGPDAMGELSSGGNVARLGYSAPQTGHDGAIQWVMQQCTPDLRYAIVTGQRKTISDGMEIAFTITTAKDGVDPLTTGIAQITAAMNKGFTDSYTSHKRWWEQFWSKSAINIPDATIEQHYYLVQYFYGAISRRGNPAVALQGLWTADDSALPPWRGDYHHDVNTQMTYWAYFTANHIDEGRCFLDFLWGLFDGAKNFARDFYGTSGACLPGITSLNGDPIAGWPQYSLSPTSSAWLSHSFYIHWRYTMDRDYLQNIAYPFCRQVAQCLSELLQKDEKGFFELPLSSSPEIHDNGLKAWIKPNSNYDLALLKWLFKAVAEMSSELGCKTDFEWAMSVYNGLKDFAVEAKSFDGVSSPGSLMISEEETLQVSHRHHSHLIAIYPLGLIHPEKSPRDGQIIDASLRHLDMLGSGLWVGFSFTWAACLAARCLKPERALHMLNFFLKGFLSRNGFNLNGDYKKLGISSWNYRPFTLEANFGAAQAVHEILMQSWNGKIQIFPAVPESWSDVSFDNLRAEGAYLVSAKRVKHQIVWVRVLSERGGIMHLANPFADRRVVWNRNDLEYSGSIYTCNLKAGEYLEGTSIY